MLVLQRELGEESVATIDGTDIVIVVRVIEVRGGKVRLGFDAPPNVRIHRREVHERIEAGKGGGK